MKRAKLKLFFIYYISEIRENKKVIYHEIRGEAERQALPESVRSRGLPTDIDVIRLVEIEG